MTQRVLITGAAGGMGTLLRPRLARPDRVLRLLDLEPVPPGDDVEVVTASVTDPAAMAAACQDVDVLIHLGGHSREAPWADILAVNIDGTYRVLEAARHAGVRLVIFASSNHAVGFQPAAPAPDGLFPRPDTYYGVSKVAGEALGSLYHDRYGLDVLCVRIGTCVERPVTERHLTTWLSPDDCARLFEAAIALPSLGFRVVWGASGNTRGLYSLDGARALGYEPRDDAESYAADVTPASELDGEYLGGAEFCGRETDFS
ncbi:NAD-dependent epimerase/dehydratase family protein [Actinophytocola oryzae]|uniref:Nucleoside-diphosphate-sugar epimerase n=1 Tax=Actinophytocola oryzae TaxID=502181 RepID=A0A4R7VVR8_9PSEU|nr:NAD(P)-dependent oxidoreductase [Actinophytocola oryzae]TDV53728.1 nucleoside-diphosphate-sugar epimerase [Actinophytocola oryzae]